MTPDKKITMALLAAKLAKESLGLLTMQSKELAKLQFRQIIMDVKALQEHLDSL